MAVNKVVFGNTTLIDISDTTATASDVASGKEFYGKDGSKLVGTSSGGGGASSDIEITKLDEVILTEDAHLMSIVTDSSWSEYDFLVFNYYITLTAQDWIYVMINSTSPSGDKYSILSTEFKLTRCANKYGTGFLVPVPITTKTQSAAFGSTVNFVLYKAATNYESGSYIKVYGGKYTGG